MSGPSAIRSSRRRSSAPTPGSPWRSLAAPAATASLRPRPRPGVVVGRRGRPRGVARTRGRAAPPRSRPAVRRFLRNAVSSSSASASRSAGWRASMPAPRSCTMQPGIGRGDDRVAIPAGGPERVDLAVEDAPRQLALVTAYAPPAPQHSPSSAVSTRSYAGASTVATAPCAFCTCRRWHGSWTTTGVPVGRRSAAVAARAIRRSRHPRAERPRLGRAEQRAVFLHRRAAPGAVDDDRRVAGHRRDHLRGASARASASRPACRCSAPQHAPPRPDARPVRRSRCMTRAADAVRVAQPRVHDASGEQPRVGRAADRNVERSGDRTGRQPRQTEPRRDQAQSLREPSASHVHARSSQWRGSTTRYAEPLRRSAAIASAAAGARRASLP